MKPRPIAPPSPVMQALRRLEGGKPQKPAPPPAPTPAPRAAQKPAAKKPTKRKESK